MRVLVDAAPPRSAGAFESSSLVRASFLLIALAPVAINLAAWALAGSPDRFELLDDDAYYYLGVGEHLASGDGPTFDGLDDTNGFHPLWLVLVALVELPRSGPSATVGLVLALQSLLWLATVRELWLIGRVLRQPALTLVAALPLVFLATANYRLAFNGMESGLVLLLMAAVVRQAVSAPAGRTRPLAAGGLLAVLVLARLDAVFVVAGLASAAWWYWRADAERVRRVALLVIPPAAAAGGYALFNLIAFGTLTPVSGQAKSLDAPFLNLEAVTEILAVGSFAGSPLWLGALALLASAAALRWGARPAPGEPAHALRPLLVGLLVGQALLALYLVVMTSWPTWPWYQYLVPYVWLVALLLLGLGRVPALATDRLAPLAAAAVTLLGAAFVTSWVRSPTYRSGSFAAAAQLDDLAPRGAPVAMGDRAGAFSFGTRRPLVQLEGLVGSPDYLEALRQGRVPAYLARRGVRFYAASGTDGRPVTVDGAPCRRFQEPYSGEGPKFEVVACDRDLVRTLDFGDFGRLRIYRYRPLMDAP